MSSSDVGLEEDTSVQDPSLSVCQALYFLSSLLLCQLHIVVPEAVDPPFQQAVGAPHLLGLLSNQIHGHLSSLQIGQPMVVDRWVVSQPLHDFFFLLRWEGPLLVILSRKTPWASG